MGDNISTVEGYHQYCGGCSVLWRDSISVVEAIQYCGGIASVHVGDSISTGGG